MIWCTSATISDLQHIMVHSGTSSAVSYRGTFGGHFLMKTKGT